MQSGESGDMRATVGKGSRLHQRTPSEPACLVLLCSCSWLSYDTFDIEHQASWSVAPSLTKRRCSGLQSSPMELNGGSVVAMIGKDCVAIATDLRLGQQSIGLSCTFEKVSILSRGVRPTLTG